MRRRGFLPVLLTMTLLLSLFVPMAARAEAPATPLLLIHGMLGSPSTTWAAAVPFFEQKGYVSGKTLFTVDLSVTGGEAEDTGILADAAVVAAEVRRILKETGAPQIDLLGKDRGGLIARILTAGDTAPQIRRAISLDAPHMGMLREEAFMAELDYAKVDRAMVSGFGSLLQAGSRVLITMEEREARFADRKPVALAIASVWVDGHNAALAGHDGLVSERSQLAWPGAEQVTNKIGPSPAEIESDISVGLGILALARKTPAVMAAEAEVNLQTAYEFLAAGDVSAPKRACEPGCQDWTLLAGHWSETTVKAMLPDRLPYELDAKGQRVFDPNRHMTRAEFAYGLTKALGLNEQLGATAFADLYGHWSLGYVQAAVGAKLVNGLSADSFGPDAKLTRAQAATLVVRAKGLTPITGASRFADAAGHWAEANINAAAEAGIIKGDERGFRPDDPVTMAEAAAILSRSFPK